jgi:threonine/homoserine/homoserine lactone efflux protein
MNSQGNAGSQWLKQCSEIVGLFQKIKLTTISNVEGAIFGLALFPFLIQKHEGGEEEARYLFMLLITL